MQAHLLVKSLWGITSGDETQPSDANSSAAITWREKSGQAAGSIYLMLEPDIQVMVAQHLMDAAVMWKKLKETYTQENAASRFLILDEFLSVSKGADESLTALCARVEDSLQKVRSVLSLQLKV